MEYLAGFISNELISAVALTILHSLWQGLIIAFLCWLILLFVKKENAQGRYIIYLSGIISVFVIVAVTFFTLYKPGLIETKGLGITGSEILIEKVVFNSESVAGNDNFKSLIYSLFPYISTLWTIGCMAFIMRFAGGIFYNIRTKNEGLQEVSQFWTDRLEKLSKKINTNKTIRLYESFKVSVPTVIGHVKPVILFPVGVISGIPVKQIEAILAHELAHIKRYDYLINLIQSIMEILFFYHPAFWWLNTRVKTERENCCDDIAMKNTGDRLMYARALSNIQEASEGNLNLSPAFSSGKGKLLSRIQRLYNRSYEKVGSGKFSTITGLMLLVAFVVLFSTGVQTSIGQEKSEPQNIQNSEIISGNETINLESDTNVSNNRTLLANSEAVIIPQDKVDKSKRKINIKGVEVDGKKYDVYLVLKDEEVLEFKLDGETIAKEDYDKYDKIIKTAIKEFDKRMAEMEQKLKEMNVKMESLQEELAEKQDKMQEEMHKILEELGEIDESEHLDHNVEQIHKNIQKTQERLHERLRHLEEGDLRHLEEGILESIEEFDFDHQLDYANTHLQEIFERMNVEKFFDSKKFEKMYNDIIDEFKQFEFRDLDRKFNEEDINKIKRNLKRNLREFEMDYNFDNNHFELEERLRHLNENEFMHQEEIQERIHKEMEHLNLMQNEIQGKMQKELNAIHKKMEDMTQKLKEKYDAGDITKEEMEEMIRKETESLHSKVQKNQEMMHQEMEAGRRGRLQDVRRIEKELRDSKERVDRDLRRVREQDERSRIFDREARKIERDLRESENRTERLISTLEIELHNDDIIDDELKSFVLTKKQLKVNGKKQSKKMYEKYLQLYENISGKELKKEFKIMLDN